MPTLRQLEYLVAVSDTRNFRRAADLAGTTQPTLSEQLKSLEDRLGAVLVERSRSHVVMTPLGAQIVEIARRMLADVGDIRALAASRGDELTGVVRIGLPPTIGPYLLPVLIPEFQRVHAGLKLYVREELPADLPSALASGRHDLVISLLPLATRDLVSAPLFREPLYLAVARSHPLAMRKGVRRTDLEGLDVLALGEGHQLHDVVQGLCADFGGRLRLDYEGTSLDTLREMVAMGLGVTFLPGLYVRAIAGRDPSIRTLVLADRSLFRTVGLIWRRSSPHQQRYGGLATLIRSIVAREFDDLHVLASEAADDGGR